MKLDFNEGLVDLLWNMKHIDGMSGRPLLTMRKVHAGVMQVYVRN